jgi:hypothetical protein
MKLYIGWTLLTLLCGLESWSIQAKTKSRIIAAGVKFTGKILGYN